MLISFCDSEPDQYHYLGYGSEVQCFLHHCLVRARGTRLRFYIRNRQEYFLLLLIAGDRKNLLVPGTMDSLADDRIRYAINRDGIHVEIDFEKLKGWTSPLGYLVNSVSDYPRFEQLLTLQGRLHLALLMKLNTPLVLSHFKYSAFSQRIPYKKTKNRRKISQAKSSLSQQCLLLQRVVSFEYQGYLHSSNLLKSSSLMRSEFRWRYLYSVSIDELESSIYTHKLAILSHSISQCKLHTNSLRGFGAKLDSLMQSCMWGETHGIPSGVEHSRLLCEMLLNHVDTLVDSSLGDLFRPTQEPLLKVIRHGRHYYCFSNDQHAIRRFVKELTETLGTIGLRTSALSAQTRERPFGLLENFSELSEVHRVVNLLRDERACVSDAELEDSFIALRFAFDNAVLSGAYAKLEFNLREIWKSLYIESESEHFNSKQTSQLIHHLVDFSAHYVSYVPSTDNLRQFVRTVVTVCSKMSHSQQLIRSRIQRSFRRLLRSLLTGGSLPMSIAIMVRGLILLECSSRSVFSLLDSCCTLIEKPLVIGGDFGGIFLLRELYTALMSYAGHKPDQHVKRLAKLLRDDFIEYCRQVMGKGFCDAVSSHAAEEELLLIYRFTMSDVDQAYVRQLLLKEHNDNDINFQLSARMKAFLEL